NIFEKNTPLHDGAVIIEDNRIVAATCYLPLSENKKINKALGTRHRAAIGLSENTDSLTIVVSEETGAVSIARKGIIKENVSREEFVNILNSFNKSFEKKKVKIKTKNTLLKLPYFILSLILSFALWIVIINSSNPIDTRTFNNIKVSIVNDEIVSEYGKTYEVVSGDTVSIKLTDTRDVIDQITESDINIVADFSKISFVNSIALEVYLDNYPSTSYKLSESNMTIEIEDIATKELNIEVEYVGEQSDQYIISNVELDNSVVSISAAKSIIDTIDRVSIPIDISNLSKIETLNIKPIVYDRHGKVIDNNKLQMSVNNVNATVYTYNKKTIEFNINVNIQDEMLKSIIDNIDYTKHEIVIYGDDSIINDINNLTIDIDIMTGIDDVASNQLIRGVNVQQYLPDGCYVDKSSSSVNVFITFKEYTSSIVSFNSSDINVINMTDDSKIELVNKTFNIRFISTTQNVSNLTLNDIKPYVDCLDIKDGNTLNVKFIKHSQFAYGDVSVNFNTVNLEDN
ncbi:MAG: diadenylate cyclase, partial [Lachnospiraceae bacterium]|nr:diadenylate cyclase [Lachnospiraceae bacterium]